MLMYGNVNKNKGKLKFNWKKINNNIIIMRMSNSNLIFGCHFHLQQFICQGEIFIFIFNTIYTVCQGLFFLGSPITGNYTI